MGDTPFLSRVKRAKLRKKEMADQVKILEDALPVYTPDELRRLQMPYNEALYCELSERGFPAALDFLKQLIEFQEKKFKDIGIDSAASSRPRLKTSKEHLDLLVEGLSNAETANREENYTQECYELLALAKRYCEDTDWGWLGEQLVIQSEVVSSKFVGDALQYKAIAQYMHGKFILDTTDSIEMAMEHFEICRESCEGEPWKVKEYFPEHKQSLYEEVCLTLYQLYYEKAKQMLKILPKNAGKYAMLAKKRASQACYTEGLTESLLLKGITDLVDNNLQLAVQSMIAAFNIQLKNEGFYDPRLKIAMERLRQGKTIAALEILLVLKDSLNIQGLPYFIAQTYRYLGEIKLGQGEASAATPLLTTALHIFNELNMIKEIEQVRNLAGISAGQELMPKYTDLIIRTGRKGNEGPEHLLKLCKWKDIREPFWTEDEASMPSGDSKSFEEFSSRFSDFSLLSTFIQEEDAVEEVQEKAEQKDETVSRREVPEETEEQEDMIDIQEEEIEEEATKEPSLLSISYSWINVDSYHAVQHPEEAEEMVEDPTKTIIELHKNENIMSDEDLTVPSASNANILDNEEIIQSTEPLAETVSDEENSDTDAEEM